MEELTSPATLNARGLFDAGAVAALKADFRANRVDAAFSLFPMMAMELWCQALDSAETAPA